MCQKHYRLGYLPRLFPVMFLLYPHGEFFSVLICILRALGKCQFLSYPTKECQIQNTSYVKWAIQNVIDNNIVILRDVMSSYFLNFRSAKMRNNLRLD